MRSRTTSGIAITAMLAGIVLTAVPVGGAAAAPRTRAYAAGAAGTAGRQAASCASWHVITVPEPPGLAGPAPQQGDSVIDDLTGVSVLSGDDVWIGGGAYSDAGDSQSWFLHWNGRSATTAPGPSLILQAQPAFNDLPPLNYPPSSSFDSDTDGWQLMGVFDRSTDFDSGMSTAEHWHDGRWTLTPMAVSPDPGTEGPWPYSVASVSPSDAWAVGGLYGTGDKSLFGITADGALIEHWNGTAWSVVPNPALHRPGAVLRAINVVSPSDIWAVGQQGNPIQTTYSGDAPLIEHWDGRTWTVVTAPAATTPSFLYGVSGDSRSDAWAVGYQTRAGTQSFVPLVERWNGTSWRPVSLPADVARLNGLIGVYAAGPDDVWATEGSSYYPLTDPELQGGTRPPIFLHWDGTTWSAVATPGPREYGLAYQYEAISGDGPGDVWAVGAVFSSYPDTSDYFNYQPLIARLSCAPAAGKS
jgi:hypothetical protein